MQDKTYKLLVMNRDCEVVLDAIFSGTLIEATLFVYDTIKRTMRCGSYSIVSTDKSKSNDFKIGYLPWWN